MGDVRAKAVRFLQIPRKCIGDRGGHALHLTTVVADEVNVNVLIDGVVRRGTMADVRVCDQADGFQDFQCPVDRRQIHTRSCVLHLGEDLLRSSVSEGFDRFQYELTLWRDSKAMLSKSLLPVVGHRQSAAGSPLVDSSRTSEAARWFWSGWPMAAMSKVHSSLPSTRPYSRSPSV